MEFGQSHSRHSLIVLVVVVGFSTLRPLSAQSSPDPSSPGLSAQTVAQRIDAQLTAEMKLASNLPLVDDATFLRRVGLDLVGLTPNPDRITRFVLDNDPDKRRKVVDELLAHPACGENWARYWCHVILYRRTDEKAFISTQALTEYLQRAFNENRAWCDIAADFITATGDVRENGATGLIMSQLGQPEETVAEMSRIFMGLQIQCAQCHDHPTDTWTRQQFHELAAFFPRVAVWPTKPTDKRVDRSFLVFANDRFQPRKRTKGVRRLPSLEHTMPNLENPKATGTKLQPVFFLTGARLDFGTSDAVRRATLADWITADSNPWFAIAIINRIWSELVGRGFSEPIDDLGPDRVCVAPQTLDLLREAFVQSGHDLKWLLSTITATEAYQRGSRTRASDGVPTFAHNTAQRLRGDQLLNALSAALQVDPNPDNRLASQGNGRRDRRGTSQLFDDNFGYDPSDRRSEVTDSIPQAMALMNSPIVSKLIDVHRRPTLRDLLIQYPDDEDLVYELYLRFLSREPTSGERSQSVRYIRKVGNRPDALEDLIWALVNSTEFRYRK